MKNVKIMGMGVALALMALWAIAQSGPEQLQPSSGGGIATINGFGTNVTLVGITTNNSVITNSAPITFPVGINRAWVTFGATNTGVGINNSEVAFWNAGNLSLSATVNGNQRVLTLGGNVANSQSQLRLSDFGPALVEDQREGRIQFTNRFTAGTPLTNITFGNIEARTATNGLGGGLAFYRTNAWTLAELGTNGVGPWRSNIGPNAAEIYITVNSGGNLTNWLINTTK